MNNSPIKKQIGANIQKFRKQLGWSQQELADLMGLSRTSIINIESGRHGLPLTEFYKLCCLFVIPPNDIFPKIKILKIVTSKRTIRKVTVKRIFKPVKL